jgi:hypothetical protein
VDDPYAEALQTMEAQNGIPETNPKTQNESISEAETHQDQEGSLEWSTKQIPEYWVGAFLSRRCSHVLSPSETLTPAVGHILRGFESIDHGLTDSLANKGPGTMAGSV